MSCYKCTKTFSFMTREHACKNCGFAFCANCVKQKILIPKLGKEDKVCADCLKKIKNPNASGEIPPPPAALQRRLELIENRPPTITVYRDSSKMQKLKRGLSKEDQDIADRLNRLHRDRKELENMPTDGEVVARLAKLKGMNPEVVAASTDSSKTGFYHRPDTRSSVDQQRDLIRQMSDEVRLEASHLTPEQDIEARLARLKGEEPPPSDRKQDVNPDEFLSAPSMPENDSVEEMNKLLKDLEVEVNDEAKKALEGLQKDGKLQEQLQEIKKQMKEESKEDKQEGEEDEDEEEAEMVVASLMAEQSLEDRLGAEEDISPMTERKSIPKDALTRQMTRTLNDMDEERHDELPWCTICNDDAAVRCKDCDGDLYCRRCFKECHDEMELKDHRTLTYQKPRGQSD